MFKKLWHWLSNAQDDPNPTPKHIEQFGGTSVDASLGVALLSESVERRNHRQRIRECAQSMSREEKNDLLDSLLLRFALYVLDLQASETHHHDVPYGLLDHSLEVASKVARKLDSPAFRVSIDFATHYRQQPCWQYAGIVGALFHDVGKAQDLEVVTSDGKDRWDPLAEPLAAFCHRNGLKKTGPEFWSYRVGRGLRSHDVQGPRVFGLVLPPKASAYLGNRLTLLSKAMIAEALNPAPEARGPETDEKVAARVAKIIHEADIESSKSNREAEAETVGAFHPWEMSKVQEFTPLPPRAAQPVPVAPPPPPPAPAPRPTPLTARAPLDLGVVFADFSSALRAAVIEGWIPLNQEGGLYVGRKHIYLHYPEGMAKIVDLMIVRGSDLAERYEEELAAHPEQLQGITPEDRVFQALLAQGCLPYSSAEGLRCREGRVEPPGDRAAKPWSGQLVLMNMPFSDLPLFEGKIILDQIGDPESTTSVNPLKSGLKEVPQVMLRRSGEEAYERRVRAELEPGRLLLTLRDAVSTAVLNRSGAWGPVFIRPDFIWVVVPDTFKILLPRMGIRFTQELENQVLRSIQEMPDVARGENGKVVLRIRLHPESKESVWAFALATPKILSPEQVAELGLWEFPVRVVEEPTPGEYAA